MATKTGKIVADFTTSLATALSVGATTATLQSATDDDGVALPTGKYYLSLDGANSSKEHIYCTLTGTALTDIKSISRQGVETTGVVRAHRLGATVTLTDFAYIKTINDLVSGAVDLDASDPLKYDGVPTLTTGSNQLATVKYAEDLAIAGSPLATTGTAGIIELATSTEIDANTATGSTGAAIVVTPDQLLNSKYGQLVTAQSTPNMTVAVRAFSVAELIYAGGNTGTITAPVTNPRIDLVVLTSTGTLAVRTGAEAVSPVPPTPTDGDIVLARITLATNTTAITNALITPYQIEKYIAPTTPTQLYKSWVAGQALSAGDALVLNSFVQPLGRILHDNNSSTAHSNVTNASYSFTVGTGNNRILFVMVNSTGSVSGVTYAGQSMTLVDSILQSGWTSYMYKLVNPPSGANTVSITGTNLYGSACQSFSNVDQATNVEAVTKSANGGGSTLPGTITPLSSCAVVFASFFAVGAGGSIISETATFNSYAGNNKTNSGFAQGNITVTNTGYVGTPQLITTGGSINCSFGPTFVTTIQVALKPANPVASSRVIKASAAAPTDLNNLVLTNLVGFARTSAAAEADVDVVYSGVAGGLSGLTMNSHYFLSNTAGAIATSAGTNSKKVGLAVSSTELLIKNENA